VTTDAFDGGPIAPDPPARWPWRLARWLERRLEAERDQLPLWLPIALLAGIAAWFVLPNRAGWLAFMLAGAALGLPGFAFAGRTRTGHALAIFALISAAGCGLVWLRSVEVAAPRIERAQPITFLGSIERVEAIGAEGDQRLIVRPEGAGLPVRLRVNVPAEKVPTGIAPGARVRLRAYMLPPVPMAVPGAYNFARAAWFQRIGGSGRALDIAVTAPPVEGGWRAWLAGARQRLAAHIRERLGGGGAGGVAAALATGEQGAIPEADAEAMRRSGMAHLLSVGGLHLTAVVGGIVLLTLRLLALSPALALRFRLITIAAGAGAVAGIAYTALTGAEVPTIRSCVAALLVLAGVVLGREPLTLRLLAVGALLVLLLWPESAIGASFQLSFAAIAAIVALHENPRVQALLGRRDEGWLRRAGRGLFGLLLTGVAVEIALAPIALFHFHRTGLYGALANIVAIPLTTFVIMPLEALALALDAIGLGAPFWWLTGKALALLLGLAHATANAPGSIAMLPAIPRAAYGLVVLGGLCGSACGGGAGGCSVSRRSRSAEPGRWRSPRRTSSSPATVGTSCCATRRGGSPCSVRAPAIMSATCSPSCRAPSRTIMTSRPGRAPRAAPTCASRR